MDDFMGGFFDFNGDGHTDLGEEFIAYKMFEDMEKTDSIPTISSGRVQRVSAAQRMTQSGSGSRKLDGTEITIILLLAYTVLSLIFGGGH